MVKIASIKTMGNQQVTSTQKAWLAGIWDGEGTFGIYGSKRANNKMVYCGRLTLSNTSEEMVEEILRIFTAVGVNVNIWRNSRPRKPNHKKEIHLTINRRESVKIGCELMFPYLICKQNRATLLLRFVNLRLQYKRKVKRDPQTGHILGVLEQGYSDGIAMYNEMRALNRVGVLDGTSETTR